MSVIRCVKCRRCAKPIARLIGDIAVVIKIKNGYKPSFTIAPALVTSSVDAEIEIYL